MKSFNKIWIPSAEKLCKFNEITHLQEKIILKSLGQSSSAYSSFLYALGSIMCVNSIEDNSNYTTIDRLFYGIYTKAYCFGGDLEYQLKCSSCNRTIKYVVNLPDVVGSLEFLSHNDLSEFTLPESGIRVKLKVPDIKSDIDYRELLEANATDTATLFMLGWSQYVEILEIPNTMPLVMKNYSFSQTIELINSLPNEDSKKLTEEVMIFRNSVYKEDTDNKLLEINCRCGELLLNYDLNPSSFDNFLAMIYNGDLNTFYRKELNFRILFPGSNLDEIAPVERDLLIDLKHSMTQQAEADSEPKNGEMDLADL